MKNRELRNENNRQKIIVDDIDFKTLFIKIKSLWYVCVIGILAGTLSGIFYYSVLSTPKYESTSMIYLRSANKKLSLESLQLNTNLTQDYEIIFTSRPNLQDVIKVLHLNYSVSQLKKMITIENPNETRILKVTVVDTNPKEAKDIANKLVSFGMDDIREIDSQEPFIVEKAISEPKRIGKTLLQTGLIGALLGLIIVLVSIYGKFALNDSFVSSDDVENTLGLPVLAVIAEDKTLTYAKLESSNSRRRKHHGKKTSK